jgi:hypothetical protein
MVVKVDSPRIAASIKLIAGGIETADLLLERLTEPSARLLGAAVAIYAQSRVQLPYMGHYALCSYLLARAGV